MTDSELIDALGGPAKIAMLLGYDKEGGVQRIHNWRTRGIPAQVKIDHPDIFDAPLAPDVTLPDPIILHEALARLRNSERRMMLALMASALRQNGQHTLATRLEEFVPV